MYAAFSAYGIEKEHGDWQRRATYIEQRKERSLRRSTFFCQDLGRIIEFIEIRSAAYSSFRVICDPQRRASA
jgi:hypothetical protein